MHGGLVDVEQERMKVEQQLRSREEVKAYFEERYRSFSQKGAFTCLDCREAVSINLPNREGSPFFFKHIDSPECSYSKNAAVYRDHTAGYEEKPLKDVGLTVFREILEGQLKPYGVTVERGFHWSKKLSFVPDFILTFSDSDEKWAVDYYTSINRDLLSGRYARHLAKRIESYKQEGFRAFSFVDHSWLSMIEETKKGTLLEAELHVSSKTNEDEKWDSFLQGIGEELVSFCEEEIGALVHEWAVRSMMYVDIPNRSCRVIRFTEVQRNSRNATIYECSSAVIPLEQTLTLHSDQDRFLLADEEEEGRRQRFKERLLEQKRQHDVEQQKKEEAARRMAEEANANRPSFEYRSYTEQEWQQTGSERHDPELDEINRNMEEISRIASLRPVDVDPRSRRWQRQESRSYGDPVAPSFERLEDQVKREKLEQATRLLMEISVSGEAYIQSSRKQWRSVVLEWLKQKEVSGFLLVSKRELFRDLREKRIVFTEGDHLAFYPLEQFIYHYQKILKANAGRKIRFEVVE